MKKQSKTPSGFVLYEGPSLIDGQQIAVIATLETDNPKTGDMVQTWIIRADLDPITASRTGADFSICGACPLRGEANPAKPTGWADNRACYVNLAFAVSGIFKAYKAGRYPRAHNVGSCFFPPDFATKGGPCIGHSRAVRLGAYGDPAAVPRWVWDNLLRFAKGWTGYSHQAAMPGADFAPDLTMVSAESEAGARAAWRSGYRTFRIISSPAEAVKGAEVICPATPEGGDKTTCAACQLCKGSSIKARSVAVVIHGAGAKHARAVLEKAA